MIPEGLHPVAARMMRDAAESGRPNAHLLPVEEARARFEADCASLPLPDIAFVRDLRIPARVQADVDLAQKPRGQHPVPA